MLETIKLWHTFKNSGIDISLDVFIFNYIINDESDILKDYLLSLVKINGKSYNETIISFEDEIKVLVRCVKHFALLIENTEIDSFYSNLNIITNETLNRLYKENDEMKFNEIFEEGE